MIVPISLFLCSLAGFIASLIVPALADLILLAAPCALASLVLLLRAYLRSAKSARKAAQKWIIIDGSNVMHWKDGTPQIDTLHEVVKRLSSLGFSPGVVFDANAGHILTGKYQHHRAMGKLLGLPEEQIMVVHKGTQADTTILAAARDLGARIVTNDRYRDWVDTHPEVREPGFLVRGGYQAGQLWLNLANHSETSPQPNP